MVWVLLWREPGSVPMEAWKGRPTGVGGSEKGRRRVSPEQVDLQGEGTF